MDFLKGYRTMIFAVIVALAGAAQVALPSLQGVITPAQYGWATMALGLITAVLRKITTTPLGQNDNPTNP